MLQYYLGALFLVAEGCGHAHCGWMDGKNTSVSNIDCNALSDITVVIHH